MGSPDPKDPPGSTPVSLLVSMSSLSGCCYCLGINPNRSVQLEANDATLLSIYRYWYFGEDAQDDIAAPAVVCYLHHPYQYQYHHPGLALTLAFNYLDYME